MGFFKNSINLIVRKKRFTACLWLTESGGSLRCSVSACKSSNAVQCSLHKNADAIHTSSLFWFQRLKKICWCKECFVKRRNWENNCMFLFIKKTTEFCFLRYMKNQIIADNLFHHNPWPLSAFRLFSVVSQDNTVSAPVLLSLSPHIFTASLCCLCHFCLGQWLPSFDGDSYHCSYPMLQSGSMAFYSYLQLRVTSQDLIHTVTSQTPSASNFHKELCLRVP